MSTDLRQRLAEAIRDEAKHYPDVETGDDSLCHVDEIQCFAEHVHWCTAEHDVITSVVGAPEAFAKLLAPVLAEWLRERAEATRQSQWVSADVKVLAAAEELADAHRAVQRVIVIPGADRNDVDLARAFAIRHVADAVDEWRASR